MPTTGESPSIVLDASVVVALLIDSGSIGLWAEQHVTGARLLAPDHLHVECSNALRRHERAGKLDLPQAQSAYRRLLTMPITLIRFELLAQRVWELRHVLTTYDAAYVALAEELGVPLATLDSGILKAPGTRCVMRTFE